MHFFFPCAAQYGAVAGCNHAYIKIADFINRFQHKLAERF